ncbi:MAG: hypothetical protein V4473_02700 [Patescibacteria group bacterium]
MTPVVPIRGSLPGIIRNDGGLYRGDLVEYFQIIFNRAQNLQHPYHNFRHMFHVMVMCYQACEYYRDLLMSWEMRNLLIAAMFHDFDHSGMMGDDDINIARAVRGLEKHILFEDRGELHNIRNMIKATEFPYAVPSEELILPYQIIRDADMSQSLSVAWIQQVVFGLAKEWNKSPLEVLQGQLGFTKQIKFHTAWGQESFPQNALNEKIHEIEELLALLETPVSV